MKRKESLNKNGTMTEVAYEKMKEMILTNRVGPGQRLNYPDLVERLQMSKTPIISALNRLETAGYVYLKPNQGYYVKDVTPHQIVQALEAREMIEMANMDSVISLVTEQDLDNLSRIHEAYCERAEQFFDRKSILLNMDFHRVLAEVGKNEFMINCIEQINEWMMLRAGTILSRYLVQFRVHEESHGHGHIIDALRKKDRKSAKRILRIHLRRPIKFVQQHLNELESL